MALTPANFESENKNSEIVNVVKVSKNIKHVGYFGKVGDFASRPPKVRIFGLADHNAIKIRGQFYFTSVGSAIFDNENCQGSMKLKLTEL